MDVNKRYANLYIWSENPDIVAVWIHKAFLDRDKIIPDNSFPIFSNNRSGDKWYE